MRSLKIHSGHPVLDKVLEKPFGIVDYEKAPEVINSRYFPDSSAHDPECLEQILGHEPRTITHRMIYDSVPAGYIHEAENVFMYRDILHARDGSAFIDSFRIFTPEKKVKSCYAGRYTKVQALNANFHIHVHRTDLSVKIIEEPVIPFFVHQSMFYGHWLLETIQTLWALEYGVCGKLLLSSWVKEVPSFLPDMLLPFGLDNNLLLFSSEAMHLRKIFIPCKPNMPNGYVTNTAKKLWKNITEFYISNNDSDVYPSKIYISRRGIARRTLLNESECEEIFVKYGFTVIQPELLPFSEQVRLFSQATHIAGPIGSAMHNIVFSLHPDRVKLLCIKSNYFVETKVYSAIEQAYGRKLYTVCANDLNYDKSKINGYRDPLNMDIKNLETAIQQWLYQ